MEKEFNAKKYFVLAFKKYIKNDFKILSKKYSPSIRELLLDYIEIYEEINDNREQDKLERSRLDLIWCNCIFC